MRALNDFKSAMFRNRNCPPIKKLFPQQTAVYFRRHPEHLPDGPEGAPSVQAGVSGSVYGCRNKFGMTIHNTTQASGHSTILLYESVGRIVDSENDLVRVFPQ